MKLEMHRLMHEANAQSVGHSPGLQDLFLAVDCWPDGIVRVA
jgi:hypothetical protein